jgi:hypothetical protein
MDEIVDRIRSDKLVSLEGVAASCRGAGTKCGLCQPYILVAINKENVNSSTK